MVEEALVTEEIFMQRMGTKPKRPQARGRRSAMYYVVRQWAPSQPSTQGLRVITRKIKSFG